MLMGIKHADVPVSDDGTLLVDNHRNWIQQRYEIESQRKFLSEDNDVNVGSDDDDHHQMVDMDTIDEEET